MQDINLADYAYPLPDDRIAKFPLPQRDHAKLQVYQRGEITHAQFTELGQFIPSDALLVFNNTKVIAARLIFQKASSFKEQPGALIEVFLLEPQVPSRLLATAMQARHATEWHCLVGNKKRWKPGETLTSALLLGGQPVMLTATWADHAADTVRLTWTADPPLAFADVVRHFGELPLPPYLKRTATEADRATYQTVYARQEGAVAAPTAGLHFTDRVLADLTARGIATDFLTLHVGAGTFQPIKTSNVWQHPMHGEQLVFTRQNLTALLSRLPAVYAVGTTSLRALESLYWHGVKLLTADGGQETTPRFFVEKLYPYQFAAADLPPAAVAIEAVLDAMQHSGQDELTGETEILIAPGYKFRVVKGLVTNYHLPGTTLMLLIAAFIGPDWRRVYDQALARDYRFLSYGDSSLLIP